MPPLAKPHRVAFVVPDITVSGPDAAYEREAALLVWAACIEACQRHPGLAVYDAESTPLLPLDGHFVPQHAVQGASPADEFYASTRRDELLWLELGLPKSGAVRLHAVDRSGKQQSFDALGAKLGDQINQAIAAWLTARSLPALPKRFEAVAAEEVVAVLRVIGPHLAEHARTWVMPASTASELEEDADDSVGMNLPDPAPAKKRPLGRIIANRLPQTLRVPALRVLELALRENLGDLILAVDAEHPQALFGKWLAKRDTAGLRKIIAAAPGWARPYAELVIADPAGGAKDPAAATPLEVVAGAGVAALCRPAHLEIIDMAADRLRDDGRIDEAVRLMTRAVSLHEHETRAHHWLLDLHRSLDRIGVWVERAHRTAFVHGCPMDPHLPWYPDQILTDLHVADALMNAGRLDEAIALRANRLEGRAASWPRHTRILETWRKDPRFAAWCYAREGAFRGDPARTVEGFGRIEPDDAVDVALFLDALVATGRESEVALAWAHFGRGRGFDGPVARLAAARCLLAAGEWRAGLEELWRVELTEPGRDEQVAMAHMGSMISCVPLEIGEAMISDRVAVGAHTLARRMARDLADFVPGAAKSTVITKALGKASAIDFEPASLAAFSPTTRGKRAIDALFGDKRPPPGSDALELAGKLVNKWVEVVYAEASEDDPVALAQAAAYVAAQALGRYLAATTGSASPLAGGFRIVAAEALALVRRHAHALADRDARALLGTLEPVLRRVDRWVGASWLAVVERSCAIDERAAGDVAGFTRAYPTVAARILGPEETAVLSASVARMHRDREQGWEAATAAQAERLALHTGHTGVDEWAEAVVAQLAAKAVEVEDAIDALLTACYLAEGRSAAPCVHAARVLFDAGRGRAAQAAMIAGMHAAEPEWRDRAIRKLGPDWKRANLDMPIAFAETASAMFEALQKGDAARAEKLGRWAVAFDPGNGEAHRNLGLALAQQGKLADALEHLVRSTREQATQILSGVLYQAGKLPEAMAVLDYACRWYVRADQWLTYGGVAYAALDNQRTVKAYALAYQLDPEAFDATQLNAYAGVLDEVADYATCEKIAQHLLRAAGDDLTWKTNAWNHLACAYIGLGKRDAAIKLAEDAVAQNPSPDNAAPFAATLERAKSGAKLDAPSHGSAEKPREPVFALLDSGDFAKASAMIQDASWRVRRAALGALRFRFASENDVEVPARARSAATAILADTVGAVDREALACRCVALAIRERAYFPIDPMPRLGDRMTRDAFYKEFRARGGIVLGEPEPPPPKFADRVVVGGSKVARASDYVALLRDLAALTPREALAQFDLDDAGYLEVSKAWAAALEADPALAAMIAAGLAKR